MGQTPIKTVSPVLTKFQQWQTKSNFQMAVRKREMERGREQKKERERGLGMNSSTKEMQF